MKSFVERLKLSTLYNWEDFKHIGFEKNEKNKSENKFIEKLKLSTLYDWNDFEYLISEKNRFISEPENELRRKVG